MSKCKHGYLHWVGDGDKRLICKKCNTYFVVDNGEIKEIEDNRED